MRECGKKDIQVHLQYTGELQQLGDVKCGNGEEMAGDEPG